MKFKIQKVLTDRQLRKAKYGMTCGILFCLWELGQYAMLGEVEAAGNIKWDGTDYLSSEEVVYDTGRIVYFSTNVETCTSIVLIPGTALLPKSLLAICYALSLIYLFMAIGIISDIFMVSIEKITARKQIVEIKNEDGETVETKQIDFWNPTVANLTLMALGSSAPEILLSVIETLTTLGKCPGELGASTIVGSAAFNLLVISGVSIYAVSEENDTDEDRDDTMIVGVKKINDLGVFAITASSSLWAYIWLFICVRDQGIQPYEAWLTLVFFFMLITFAYGADKFGSGGDDETEEKQQLIEYDTMDFYNTLIKEKQGLAGKDKESQLKIEKMKNYLRETMNTDQIENVSMEELKRQIEGKSMLTRAGYRKTGLSGRPKIMAKGAVFKQELKSSEHVDNKHDDFGFPCLHYSVSEASGSLKIAITNKRKTRCSVRVRTIDQEAYAGQDFELVDQLLQFKEGEESQSITVIINDDDNWEPDEDFWVQLYEPSDPSTTPIEQAVMLKGGDTKTIVTIIDDDKPGSIAFEDQKPIKAVAAEGIALINVIRKNGSDGTITVNYKTVQLDDSAHTATDKVDYEHQEGMLTFTQGQTLQTIEVKILDNGQGERDEAFGIQLSDITPAGAKLSKKNFHLVNIVTDAESKKKAEALAQLLKKIQDEEEQTWYSQFVSAAMLHANKDDDGEIQDVVGADAFTHLICIGWKLLFAFTPPPHILGGWACFIGSLSFIGVVTFVVGEFANLFGCVLNIKPSITAITFVALGTSLPDTFASMTAAQEEKYADSAVGNVTGSNSVNVFLGLGLPWVIASVWSANFTPSKGKIAWDDLQKLKYFYRFGADSEPIEDDTSLPLYYVPAGSLGFSVVVFCCCAVTCIIFLMIRRKVVGGELGGSPTGRLGSCVFLVTLWFIYIIMSIMQAYNIAGLGSVKIGTMDEADLSISVKYWLTQCDKRYDFGDALGIE